MARVKVVILGAGGHAKAVVDAMQENQDCELVGCVTPNKDQSSKTLNVLGDDDVLSVLYEQGVQHAVIAIGDNRARHELADKVRKLGFSLFNVIHPTAYVANSATLGSGVVILARAVVVAEAVIHDNTIINTGATVDHDSVIGDSCHIAPGCSVSGKVTVGTGTFIGTGANVIDDISIGSWSIIGAGAAVVRDIPDHCVAFGVPARVMRSLK